MTAYIVSPSGVYTILIPEETALTVFLVFLFLAVAHGATRQINIRTSREGK